MQEPSGAIYSSVSCPRTGARDQTIDFLISWRLAIPPELQPPLENESIPHGKYLIDWHMIVPASAMLAFAALLNFWKGKGVIEEATLGPGILWWIFFFIKQKEK